MESILDVTHSLLLESVQFNDNGLKIVNENVGNKFVGLKSKETVK
jgi:transcription-repair coupling factor (superfamily II helicase)